MPAVLDCIYQDKFAPRISLFEAQTYVVGRGADCDIVIAHPTVSRRHCLLAHRDGKWVIQDLHSTNGLTHLGARHKVLTLEHQLIFQIGSVTCVLEAKTSHELAVSFNRNVWARQQISLLKHKLTTATSQQELLTTMQYTFTQLLGSDRCAVILLDRGRELTVCSGFPQWLQGEQFNGTTTLIKAAIQAQRPFVVNNATLHEQLRHQASVQKAEIKAAVAYPIEVDGVVIAVLYADSLHHHHYFTEHDIDLISNFSSMLALQLALTSIDEQIELLAESLTHLAS